MVNNVLVALALSFIVFVTPVSAQSAKPKGVFHCKNSYCETVKYFEKQIGSNWCRDNSGYNDGVKCQKEIESNCTLFKVSRYYSKDSNLDPFLIIRIERVKNDQCEIAVWEGCYAFFKYVNWSPQIPKWIKQCETHALT